MKSRQAVMILLRLPAVALIRVTRAPQMMRILMHRPVTLRVPAGRRILTTMGPEAALDMRSVAGPLASVRLFGALGRPAGDKQRVEMWSWFSVLAALPTGPASLAPFLPLVFACLSLARPAYAGSGRSAPTSGRRAGWRLLVASSFHPSLLPLPSEIAILWKPSAIPLEQTMPTPSRSLRRPPVVVPVPDSDDEVAPSCIPGLSD